MGSADTPTPPDYKGQAIATSNASKYDEQGPTGSVSWTVRPGADPNNPQPGDYIRTTTMSPEQQALYRNTIGNQTALGNVAGAQIQGLAGGTQAVQDALYRRSTRYYDQNFGDQEAALRSRLINSGLAEGSEAYDRAMRNFGQTRDSAYADATDRAILGGEQAQGNMVSRLAQIMAMAQGQAPQSANSNSGQGPDLLSAANNQYQAQLGAANAENAQTANTTNALGSIATMAAIYF